MKRTIICIFFAITVIFCFGCTAQRSSSASTQPSTLLVDNTSTKVLTNKVLHVTLRYPKDWIQVAYDDSLGTQEFEGQDGNFSISCVTGSGKDIDGFVKDYYDPKSIKMKHLKIDGQKALLIHHLSSEESDDTTLYVEYPKNINIINIEHARGTSARFNIFQLDADKKNIMNIAKSIRFH